MYSVLLHNPGYNKSILVTSLPNRKWSNYDNGIVKVTCENNNTHHIPYLEAKHDSGSKEEPNKGPNLPKCALREPSPPVPAPTNHIHHLSDCYPPAHDIICHGCSEVPQPNPKTKIQRIPTWMNRAINPIQARTSTLLWAWRNFCVGNWLQARTIVGLFGGWIYRQDQQFHLVGGEILVLE